MSFAQFPDVLTDRYRRFKFGHYAPNIDHYQQLALAGQHPDVMVVSCCDSRVSPELIFSALPGELFIVRNVANLIPPFETDGKYHGVSAALEYASLTLEVGHIVILGHSGCGGISACFDHGHADRASAPFITGWISMLDGARAQCVADHPGSDQPTLKRALEMEAIKTSIGNLRTFPCIQQMEAKARLKVHGAFFDIGRGELSVLDQGSGMFGAL
ncbi:MAG: carbonic anhydrase [Pseudomonadota bacterium]